MKSFFLSLIGVFLCLSLQAQTKFTVSGYVKEAATGETLSGATAFLKDSEYGAYTNEYGFYSVTAPAGKYVLQISYLGFETQLIDLDLSKDARINVDLKAEDLGGEKVVIAAERTDENVKSTEMGAVELKIEAVKKLPVLMGEVDILKTIQLLPGVQAAEGTTGLYIRGGGPDQNLMLIDGAPVYNAGHMLGFFSVFNSDAVRDFKLHKGNMPAQYGGRLASVIDVSMREGNNQSFHARGGLGLISSRLLLEGPILKDKMSFMVSGRRTYADVLAQPFIKKDSPFRGSKYYFYDFNAKVNYTISDKDRLFLSGYFGRDIFNFKSGFSDFAFNIPWGNATTTLRWNHLFNDKLFMNTSVIYNDYDFKFGAEFRNFEFRISSRIQDYNAKVDFDWFADSRHKVKFGANYIYHIFDPNGLSVKLDTLEIDQSDRFRKYAHEGGIYIQDEWSVSDKIQINGGLRLSAFQQVGPYGFVNYDPNEQPIDTTQYAAGDPVKTFGGVEPRFAIRYGLSGTSSLKASVNWNTQYIHMVSVAGTLPGDIWVPSSRRIQPQRGTQYSIGYFQNFKENIFETSVELYYRTMKNQVEYSQYYTFDGRKDYELDYVFGAGESYGAEFFIQKTQGKLTGWIGYTLARTQRTFPDLNDGKTFPYTYDRRHNISVVATYELPKPHISFSGTFVYGTGNAITLPVRRYIIDGAIVNEFGERNSYRMMDYHRADISVTFHGKPNKKFKSDWVVSVYNMYDRRNPYFIYFNYEGNPATSELVTKAYKVSVFPIIPSVTWNFEF